MSTHAARTHTSSATAGAVSHAIVAEIPAQLELTKILYALSDPHRLGIVRKLHHHGAISCTEAATACENQGCSLPRATLSHHFRILRESGLITSVKHGQQHLNTLRLSEVEDRFPGLLTTILALAV